MSSFCCSLLHACAHAYIYILYRSLSLSFLVLCNQLTQSLYILPCIQSHEHFPSRSHVYMQERTHTHIHTHTHLHTHTLGVCTHTHTCTHACTHIHPTHNILQTCRHSCSFSLCLCRFLSLSLSPSLSSAELVSLAVSVTNLTCGSLTHSLKSKVWSQP